LAGGNAIMHVKQIKEYIPTGFMLQRKLITTERLQCEFDYYRSLKLLQKMLCAGLITEEEFTNIDRLNRKSFSPFGAEIMP
jgi:hypothetical protein